MRKALRIALGVPQCTKNELVHLLSDTMPLNYRVRQAAFICHNKILHFGSQHPLYKAISKVGNFPIMKPKRTKPQNRPGKIVNKRQTWAAVMIDLRKKLKLEIPAYDKPVTYLPQVNYLEKLTFHINLLVTEKNICQKKNLKQEGQRIQNSVVTPELLNHNADNYFTDGSVCQETGQAGASALWVNDKDCVPGPIVLQAKITRLYVSKIKSHRNGTGTLPE